MKNGDTLKSYYLIMVFTLMIDVLNSELKYAISDYYADHELTIDIEDLPNATNNEMTL